MDEIYLTKSSSKDLDDDQQNQTFTNYPALFKIDLNDEEESLY
jgi:hypothetical protein